MPVEYLTAIREDIRALHEAMQTAPAAVSTVGADVRAAALGVFQAIATLLAVRALLLLALAGAFVVAMLALRAGTWQADGVLVGYAVLILIPLVWLERNPRVGGPHG